VDIANSDLVGLDAMDNARNLTQLADLGAKAAQQQIQPNHFPAAFDIAAAAGSHA